MLYSLYILILLTEQLCVLSSSHQLSNKGEFPFQMHFSRVYKFLHTRPCKVTLPGLSYHHIAGFAHQQRLSNVHSLQICGLCAHPGATAHRGCGRVCVRCDCCRRARHRVSDRFSYQTSLPLCVIKHVQRLLSLSVLTNTFAELFIDWLLSSSLLDLDPLSSSGPPASSAPTSWGGKECALTNEKTPTVCKFIGKYRKVINDRTVWCLLRHRRYVDYFVDAMLSHTRSCGSCYYSNSPVLEWTHWRCCQRF